MIYWLENKFSQTVDSKIQISKKILMEKWFNKFFKILNIRTYKDTAQGCLIRNLSRLSRKDVLNSTALGNGRRDSRIDV